MKILRRLYDWVLSLAETPYGLLGLIAVSFMESSFFPIPPDVLLIALCVGKPKSALKFAFYCTLFSVLGGLFGYFIGAFLWGELSEYFFKYIPGFTHGNFEKIKQWYSEYGFWVVFVAGSATPIPYKVFTIASGVFDMRFEQFLLASIFSRGIRFYLVAVLIRIYGNSIKTFIDKYFNILSILFFVLLVSVFLTVKLLPKPPDSEQEAIPINNVTITNEGTNL